MPVLGCFQGRAIARAMCTTVVYHSGGQNPLILHDLLKSQAFEIAWCPGEAPNYCPSRFDVGRKYRLFSRNYLSILSLLVRT